MIGFPALGSPARSGWLGAFRDGLQARWSEMRRSAEDQPGDIAALNARPRRAVLVLVVDDNPVNLLVISARMQSRGVVPLLAADGAEAVALACEVPFDLILMDLQMPILDGLEATSAIRGFETRRSRPAVPVVAHSSMSPGAAVLAAHGLNGFLTKPCGDQELDDCLVRWCPTYRSGPVVRDAPHGSRCWPPASRAPGTSRAPI